MDRIVKKLHKDVEAAITDGMAKGLLNVVIDECRGYYKNLEGIHEYKVHVLNNHCYKLNDNTLELKDARKCYADNIAELEKQEKKDRSKTITCFQRHYAAYRGQGAGEHPPIPL
ncbi:uncharacterized protein LOC117170740 [Belonocnema kinseyi]|uniref:uncharacterized protein LOC117170740 n=1 Tax=Belonocnema kinseyi TaxID=2817044 RepID=UPI00143DFD52|nr:uncharacterized protein LOC117170740 [Belonocnema kinseyi]